MSMNASLIGSGSIIGASLSSNPNWATVPMSALFLFTTLATFPASILMQRKGRRFGFIFACLVLMLGGIVSAFAIQHASFLGFIVGSMIFGVSMGFFQLIRFAAIDIAPVKYLSKAVSWVLLGGLLAAFLGPNMAAATHMLDAEHPFYYTMLCAVPLGIAMIVLLSKVDFPTPSVEEISGYQRPLKEIITQPIFIVAVVCAMIAYGLMILLMTATPLAMKGHGFEFKHTAFIIQWHFVGMFAPSFFTGNLIERFGVLRVMMAGVIAYLLVVVLNMQPQSLSVYWFALVLLGIGWNFLFIGATSLLSGAWLPAEKGRVQGINDTLVFSMSALAAMSSGVFYSSIGWKAMNLVSLPFCAVAISLIIYLMWKRESPVSAPA